MKTVEIICTACGAEALLRREPVYDGLKKTGERLFCSACGHEYAAEDDVVFKHNEAAPRVFSADDRPEKIELFAEGENRNLCRYCADYVVNPFMQFCALHRREVQATDTCPRFRPPPEKPDRPAF